MHSGLDQDRYLSGLAAVDLHNAITGEVAPNVITPDETAPMTQPGWDYIAKLIALGDSGSGKSSVRHLALFVLNFRLIAS